MTGDKPRRRFTQFRSFRFVFPFRLDVQSYRSRINHGGANYGCGISSEASQSTRNFNRQKVDIIFFIFYFFKYELMILTCVELYVDVW